MRKILSPIFKVVLGLFFILIVSVPVLKNIFLIISSVIFFLFAIFLIFLIRGVDKQEKRINSYLDECDEKLKRGEMTQEENDEIHFYYEYDFKC